MKRKTTSTPVRIWSYGCCAPRGNVELVQDQLGKAHSYYNELVAIERARRSQFREVRSASAAGVAALEAELRVIADRIEAERSALQKKRAQARKRVRDPDIEDCIRALLAERKTVGLRLREERQRYLGTMRELDQLLQKRVTEGLLAIGQTGPRAVERVRLAKSLEMLSSAEYSEVWKWSLAVTGAAVAAKKAARAACGLSSGTYLLVEKAVEGAKDPEFRSIGKLRRRDWYPGTADVCARYLRGRIGVTMRGVVTVRDLFSADGTQLRIAPLPDTQWDTRGGRARARTDVLFRVASGEKGEPVWTTFRATLHRKPPMDARVRSAWLLVDHSRRRTTFELQLALESEAFHPALASGGGVAAVDFGWRQRDTGIRVAYVVDDAGRERELILPESEPDMLRQAARIQSARDLLFNQARAVLGSWLEGAAAVPEWLRASTEHIALWRDYRRLLGIADRLRGEHLGGGETDFWKLWRAWKAERLGHPVGKQDLFAPLEEARAWARAHGVEGAERELTFYLCLWARKEWHLYDFQGGVTARAVRRRYDLYRCFAKELRETYGTVLYEDMELATASYARNVKPEAASPGVTGQHRLQREAAPGELKQLIAEACGARGVAMEAAYSTRRCHRCRHVNSDWEHPDALVQVCAGCGASWDIDSNACKNFLIAWSEGSGAGGKPGTSRAPENSARIDADDGDGAAIATALPAPPPNRSQRRRQMREEKDASA